MNNYFKKTIGLMLVLVITASLLAACSKPETSVTVTDIPTATVDDGEAFDLKIAMVTSRPHQWISMAEHFAEVVKAETNGKVNVTLYPGGQLGSDETVIDELRNGTIDFTLGGTQNIASFVPEIQIFGIAYLLDDENQCNEVIAPESPVYKRFQDLFEEKKLGLKLIGLSNGGLRSTLNNLRPIVTPTDIKGMKMRLTGSPMEAKIWGALGAIPTSLPWNDVYSAVQTGVVDAFEASMPGYKESKTYEVAPYLSKTEHIFMITHFTMSEKTYDKLPLEYNEIIQKAADEACLLGKKLVSESAESLLKELEDENDVKINEVDKKTFSDIVQPLYGELAKSINAEDILDMIYEMR